MGRRSAESGKSIRSHVMHFHLYSLLRRSRFEYLQVAVRIQFVVNQE